MSVPDYLRLSPQPPGGPLLHRGGRTRPDRRHRLGPGLRPAARAIGRWPRPCWRSWPSWPRTRSTWRMLHPQPGDELGLQDAVGELLRLSLVDREGEQLRVRRLVQDVVRARLSEPAARQRRTGAADCATPQRTATTPAGRPGRRTWSCWPGTGWNLATMPTGWSTRCPRWPPGTPRAPSTRRPPRSSRPRCGWPGCPAAPEPSILERRLSASSGEVSRHRRPAGRGAGSAPARGGHPATAAGRTGRRRARARGSTGLGHVLNCADDIEAAIAAHRRALAALDGAGRDDLTHRC